MRALSTNLAARRDAGPVLFRVRRHSSQLVGPVPTAGADRRHFYSPCASDAPLSHSGVGFARSEGGASDHHTLPRLPAFPSARRAGGYPRLRSIHVPSRFPVRIHAQKPIGERDGSVPKVSGENPNV